MTRPSITRLAALSLLLSLLLAGCAISPPTPTATVTAKRNYHDAIELEGRLSVRYQKDGQEESSHGNFNWSQTPEHTIITLRSPLGQTLAVIDITPKLSTLTQSGHAPRSASDPDALAALALGWQLPISGMRDWLQGFAVNAQGRRIAAAPSDATFITTPDDWRVIYASWQESDVPAAAPRPKRIDMERHTRQADAVALRIVLDTWQPR